jgi:hypothetical protein
MMRRHELDPVSLTFGFLFTALGLLFLIGRADDAFRLRWIWPLLLLVLGAGILLDIARGRGRTDPAPEFDSARETHPTSEADQAPEALQAREAHPVPEAEETREAEEARVAEEAVDSREQPR